MAKLVDDAGVEQTPEEIAAEALKDVEMIVTFNQNIDSDLDLCARNLNKNTLVNARNPEKLWNDNRETWRNDAIVELIKAKAKAISDYLDKQELDEKKTTQYVAYLLSTGMSYTEARKQAKAK